MLPFPSRSLRFFGLPSVRGLLRAARLGALAESLPLAEGLGDPAGFDLVAGLFDVRAFNGVALRLSEGRDDGEDEYDENGGEGDEGVDVRHEFEPSLPVAGLDEELEADEREDRGEPVVKVDEPFEEPFDEEEELAQPHEREGVGGEDDDGWEVSPKDAGIESRANMRSADPMEMMHRKKGVTKVLWSRRTIILSPTKPSVTKNILRAPRTTAFGLYSSSSWSGSFRSSTPSRSWFHAVHRRKAAKIKKSHEKLLRRVAPRRMKTSLRTRAMTMPHRSTFC